MAETLEDRLAEVWSTFVAATESRRKLIELVADTNSLNNNHLGNNFMWAVVDHCDNFFTLTYNGTVKLEKVPLERILGYMEAVNATVTSELDDEVLEGGF